MIKWLASFLTAPIIGGFIDGYKAKLAAGNNTERIAADLAAKELDLDRRQRELSAQVLIAEQGRWYTAWPRPAFALVIFVYFAKVIVWDKVLGWGVTDALEGTVGDWAGVIITAYFGGRTVEKVARIFARR
jgi:hypothetical protein